MAYYVAIPSPQTKAYKEFVTMILHEYVAQVVEHMV